MGSHVPYGRGSSYAPYAFILCSLYYLASARCTFVAFSVFLFALGNLDVLSWLIRIQ